MKVERMNHASLCSGIGLFDYAAKQAGYENIFQVEIDKWCHKVLNKHYPETEKYFDLKEFNGEKYRGTIDVISGGEPCQPHSLAGRGGGKSDPRYLWPEVLRITDEVQPGFLLNENVPGSIYNGILDQKISDLENIGYSCFTPLLIPASAFGAPHKRDRIWLLAYSNGKGLQERIQAGVRSIFEKVESFQGSELARIHSEKAWDKFPTQSPIYRGNDGSASRLYRNQRIKALGNGIVWQIAFIFFELIKEIEHDRRFIS
jgi:DNA (cytosine-5)-methyltransferase 1